MSLLCWVFGHKREISTWVEEDLSADEFVCTLSMECHRCGRRVSEVIARSGRKIVAPKAWWHLQTAAVQEVIRKWGWYDTH